MDKDQKAQSLDGRIERAIEVVKNTPTCIFRYMSLLSPVKREECNDMELSQEEVESLLPQLSVIFKQEIEISSFDIVVVSGDNYLKLGIENGEGLIDGKKYDFKYLMVQEGEFIGMQMCCKDEKGKGMDHEVYPLFTFSKMPEDTQILISSMLDIVEERLI